MPRALAAAARPSRRSSSLRVVFYVTGHGFGHAVRVSGVIAALLEGSPTVRVDVRTTTPAWLFPRDPRVRVEPGAVDVGLVQRDPLVIDFEATLCALERLEARWDRQLEEQAHWIEGSRVVVADLPPLAFAAAHRAGVPAVGLANFSWDWVYRSYAAENPAFARHADRAASAYGTATELLRLPFHADLGAFPVIRDLPLIARHSLLTQDEARQTLGIPRDRRVVLLSFGGSGSGDLGRSAIDALPDVTFVTTHSGGEGPPNLLRYERDRVQYEDLLRASDVVVTKPGYGITSEALVNGIRVLYSSRGQFPEFEILERALHEHGTAAFISPEALRSGALADELQQLLARPVRGWSGRADGAAVAARRLREWL